MMAMRTPACGMLVKKTRGDGVKSFGVFLYYVIRVLLKGLGFQSHGFRIPQGAFDEES